MSIHSPHIVAEKSRWSKQVFALTVTGKFIIMSAMRFGWNPEKAARNFAKHRVRFEEVNEVFNDDFAAVQVDEKHSFYEQRYNIIGLSGGRLLFVVYTVREDDLIWLISAREIEPYEKNSYYKGFD
jgi:uncharacterized DUF497 family protein